jgi:hypothetical protein
MYTSLQQRVATLIVRGVVSSITIVLLSAYVRCCPLVSLFDIVLPPRLRFFMLLSSSLPLISRLKFLQLSRRRRPAYGWQQRRRQQQQRQRQQPAVSLLNAAATGLSVLLFVAWLPPELDLH